MPSKTPFRFLSVVEFGQLSRTEKFAYLALATQEVMTLEGTLDTQRADFDVEHKFSRKH